MRFTGTKGLNYKENMRYGYIRVSTKGQNPGRQIMKLQDYCDLVVVEYFSAKTASDRKEFLELVQQLKPGDEFVVWQLSRAFRLLKDAIFYEEKFREEGISFTILKHGIDTSTAKGRRDFYHRAANAECDRLEISEATIDGLADARSRGIILGRPHLLTLEEVEDAWQLYYNEGMMLKDIATMLGVEPWTVTRNIQNRLDENGKRLEEKDHPKTIRRYKKRIAMLAKQSRLKTENNMQEF